MFANDVDLLDRQAAGQKRAVEFDQVLECERWGGIDQETGSTAGEQKQQVSRLSNLHEPTSQSFGGQQSPSVREGVPNPPRRQARRAQLGRSGREMGGAGSVVFQAGSGPRWPPWPVATRGAGIAPPAPWQT